MNRPWLLPLVPLYAAGSGLRWVGLKPKRLGWPVISVGNLSAGGAGKTPFTIALAQLLQREGFHVDVLSRGYGRKSKLVERVDPAGSAERYGDEPILIASSAGVPVYVGSDRWRAGRLAEQEAGSNTGIHLLDDGFQHRQLHRDIDILLLNDRDWFEESLLPAGNLREPRSALRRATVVAIPAEDAEIESDLRKSIYLDRGTEAEFWQGPIWRYRRTMEVPPTGSPVVAFCGIARPEQFFAGLEHAGVAIAERHAFRDHQPFTRREIEMLRAAVARSGAKAFVATAKDRIRLGSLAADLEQIAPLHIVGLRIELEDEAKVAAWLQSRLQR